MWEYNYTPAEDELYHYGIKGMKWGVRRYQNSDGSLTAKGKKRYSDNSAYEVKTTDGDTFRVSRGGTKNYNTKQSKVTKTWGEHYKEIDDAKLAQKQSKKSKHRQKLEAQYKSMGLTDAQVKQTVDNRIKTEKILAASAALTVAACSAYVINKNIKARTDGIIKSGELLQRIEMQDTQGQLHDVFYVAKGKHDSKRYAGLLGATRKQQTGHAYMMQLKSNGDIKVASKDKATKIFADLYKNDPDFRKNAEQYAKAHFTGKNKANVSNLSNRNMKKMYENFNANLIGIREGKSGIDTKFYDKLKKAGYGAVQDVNDMKFSGYNAKNPLIVFNNSNRINVQSMTEMTGNLNKAANTERLKISGESAAKTFFEKVGPILAISLTGKAASAYKKKPDKDEVKQQLKYRYN